MAMRDTIPATRPDRPFPAGDIADPEKERSAREWLAEAEALGDKRFMERVKKAFARTALSGLSGLYATHTAAIYLSEAWDKNRGERKDLAAKGYMVAAAFNNAVRYLPIRNVNLSSWLGEMQTMPQDMVPLFAQTAWEGMEAYAHVYQNFDRLFDHAQARFHCPDNDREYLRAGMALPYMIGWASNLVESTPSFTGMVDARGQNLNIQTADFKQFLTNEALYVPRNTNQP